MLYDLCIFCVLCGPRQYTLFCENVYRCTTNKRGRGRPRKHPIAESNSLSSSNSNTDTIQPVETTNTTQSAASIINTQQASIAQPIPETHPPSTATAKDAEHTTNTTQPPTTNDTEPINDIKPNVTIKETNHQSSSEPNTQFTKLTTPTKTETGSSIIVPFFSSKSSLDVPQVSFYVDISSVIHM